MYSSSPFYSRQKDMISSSYKKTTTSLTTQPPQKKLYCLNYIQNYNMWCSVEPCKNCFDYALHSPQWCFAGSIKSRLDYDKQCDISDVSTKPICRGCLVKYCYRNSIFINRGDDSSSLHSMFVVNKNNFNSLFTIDKKGKNTDIYLCGSIEKDEKNKKYSAVIMVNKKKICTIKGGKVFPSLSCSSTSLSSYSTAAESSSLSPSSSSYSHSTYRSTATSSLSQQEEQFIEQSFLEILKKDEQDILTEEKMLKELFLECASEQDLDHYFMDKREKELEIRNERDYSYTAAERDGRLHQALKDGKERYLHLNDRESIDLWGSDVQPPPPIATTTLQFEQGIDSLLKYFPNETIRNAFITGMIKKLLEVITSSQQ